MKHTIRIATALLACGFSAAGATAQEQEPEVPKPRLEDQNPMSDNSQDEIRELFKKVERKLRKIDRLLLDASAGDTSVLSDVKDAGLDDLFQDPNQAPSQGGPGLGSMLGASQAQGQEVLRGIDRIIEIAQEAGSASSACSNPDPNQPSPLDNRGQQKTQQNQTPEQPQQDQPQESDEPKSPNESNKQDKNQPASRAPDAETQDPARPSQDQDRWGDLPIHVREIFRAEGGRQMPSQYRDWIDAYYRRLNARSGN